MGPPGGWQSQWGGGPVFSDAFRFRSAPTPYDLVESYKSLIYACIQLNVNGVTRTPLRLYAITKKGQARPKCAVKAVSRKAKQRLRNLDNRGADAQVFKAFAHAEEIEEVTDHPILEVVTNVNPEMDHLSLLAYTVMSLEVAGSAYWWPNKGAYGIPTELWTLPPHLVYPMFTSGGLVPDSYMYGGYDFKPNELVRFRRMSMKNPFGQGYSPAQAAIEYARLEDVWTSMCDDMLSNGPRPSLLVSHRDPKGSIGQAERRRLELDMNQKGRGGRAGSVFFADGALMVQPITYPATDLAGMKVSEYVMDRLANCFGVPVSMLQTEDVNRANAEAGLAQHARDAIEPRCKVIASTLTRWVHSLDRNGSRGFDRLFFAFDSAVAEDRAAEMEYLTNAVNKLGLPPNKALTELGFEDIGPEGDVSYLPTSLQPIGTVANPKADEPATPGKPETEIEGDDDNETVDEAEETEEEADAKALRAKALDLVARVQAELDKRKA